LLVATLSSPSPIGDGNESEDVLSESRDGNSSEANDAPFPEGAGQTAKSTPLEPEGSISSSSPNGKAGDGNESGALSVSIPSPIGIHGDRNESKRTSEEGMADAVSLLKRELGAKIIRSGGPQ
jgi:hypothetical protein